MAFIIYLIKIIIMLIQNSQYLFFIEILFICIQSTYGIDIHGSFKP
jgi:hypothetical protein